MLFNSFWKKLFILNIVLLIVVFRIFSVLDKYINKQSYNYSLFPLLSEDGYPFFNAINCDIKQLTLITKNIISNDNENIIISPPEHLMISKECSFIDKYILCKNNPECIDKINKKEEEIYLNNKIDSYFFDKFYHSKIIDSTVKYIIGINGIINIMNTKNEFNDKNNNKIEISFYHKIISGFNSFLFIKQFDNNIKNNINLNENDFTNYNLLKRVTQDENTMNNLFYFYSLILYSFTKYNQYKAENNTENENNYLYLNYALDCLKSNDFYNFELISKNKNIFQNLFMKEFINLFNCLYDINEKISFDIDFTAINTMIKIISEDKNISYYEYNSLNLFLIEVSKMINLIFSSEIQLNNKVSVLRQNYIYILIIFICLSVALILFINRHLMRNKKKYENKGKKRDLINKMKYENLSKNANKFENINNDKNSSNIDNKKLTNEELEYIKKLASENKADFLISK